MPFAEKARSPHLYSRLTTPKLVEAYPKLEVTTKLLPKPARPDGKWVEQVHITFADGSKHSMDMTKMLVPDLLENIDIINGQIAAEEVKRGKPFS